jgi:3-oxoadipate enol-lactonase
MAMMEHIVVSDGCRIGWRLDGAVGAPVLVLSNALGTTADMWSPQLAACCERFRVLRYDSRGHGASEAPAGPYSIERLARDILDLLDAQRLERVRFCGLSMGGMVGQWLGAHAPERLERLVVANTAAFMGPASMWQQRIDIVRREGMRAVADAVIGRWFTPGFRARAPGLVAGFRKALLAMPATGYAGCCAAIRDMDLREDAARIAVPTLLIAGALDPATPPAATAAIAGTMPVPPTIVTLDAAHLSNVEQPEPFTNAVLAFLS